MLLNSDTSGQFSAESMTTEQGWHTKKLSLRKRVAKVIERVSALSTLVRIDLSHLDDADARLDRRCREAEERISQLEKDMAIAKKTVRNILWSQNGIDNNGSFRSIEKRLTALEEPKKKSPLRRKKVTK